MNFQLENTIELNKYIKENEQLKVNDIIMVERDIVTKTKISGYLSDVQKRNGRNEKIQMVLELMNFLVFNKLWLKQHDKLKLIVKNKIIEFAEMEHLYFAKHFHILFDECLLGVLSYTC